MSQNEKLIQNGFELIVRAFDDMERDCKEKVRMLEKKVNELEKENNELRQDNKMLLNENRKMEQIINNLNYNLDSTKKKLDIVRLSVVDNNNNNNNNIHRKGSKDNSSTRNNMSLKRNVTSGGRLNTVSSINTNNNNNNNLNNSEYYLNTATTLPLDTEIEDDESVDVNYIQPQLNPTKSLLNPNYHAKSINNNNNNTNYIQQLKSSHFRTHSLNYPSTTRERCLTTIGKETLTTNPNEINNFLMKCKEIITANIFEKILLLFNNHKTGLISTHDLIKRIREFISSNKYLTNIFNQLIIIN